MEVQAKSFVFPVERIREIVTIHADEARSIAIGISNDEKDTFFWNSAIVWQKGAYKANAWLVDNEAIFAYMETNDNWNTSCLKQVLRVLGYGKLVLRVFIGPWDFIEYEL